MAIIEVTGLVKGYDDTVAVDGVSFTVDEGEIFGILGPNGAGLEKKQDTEFRNLSGGQKQRLSVALALVGNPRIAVLDELTTGLDPQARRDTWDLIEQIRDSGVTVVLVTHFMEEAERLCDRLAVIDAGRVVAIDAVPEGARHGHLRRPVPDPAAARARDDPGTSDARPDLRRRPVHRHLPVVAGRDHLGVPRAQQAPGDDGDLPGEGDPAQAVDDPDEPGEAARRTAAHQSRRRTGVDPAADRGRPPRLRHRPAAQPRRAARDCPAPARCAGVAGRLDAVVVHAAPRLAATARADGHRHARSLFSYAGYIYAIAVLPGRWKFAGVSATGVFAATSLVEEFPPPDLRSLLIYLAIVVFVVVLACVVTFLSQLASEQSRKRKEMVDQLAATMEENAGLHAQLLIQAREAGVLDERQRMAREIHDTLAQGFTGIITQLQAAEQSDDWRAHVGTAARLARENLTEARRSVHALRPPQLENAGLPEALAAVVEGWVDAEGVHVELTTTGTARSMHTELEVALLRTAQEALANVAKHARASRVGLALSYMEDLVTLDVRDDGIGFDPDVVKSDGYGLMTMRHRMSRLAGALEVESQPGAGTAVSASVPAIPAEVAR
jgi:signal transduction histidine kinase/ABC-type nitrate/sulfonate/bicarbonate transport system ATPase subunit